MTNPVIEELAAAVRKSAFHQSAAEKKLAKQIASDFRTDLADIPDEVIGEVLLRAAVFAANVFKSNPGTSARDLSSLLAGAGQRLFHHPVARETADLQVEWHVFDYDDKSTAPPHEDFVWINERFYSRGVTMGYFDGFTFRTSGGSDDCSVSHWAEIEEPEAPPAPGDLEATG